MLGILAYPTFRGIANTVVIPVTPPTASNCPVCTTFEADLNISNSYTPLSAADLINATNAGKAALISSSFSIQGATLAANQIIVPRGGALTGTAINLNGATIAVNTQQAFSPSARFNLLYEECLSPEMFGIGIGDDYSAVEAMMLNGEKGINAANANYVFNGQKFLSGLRTFNWNGNGAQVTTTYAAAVATAGGTVNKYVLVTSNSFRIEMCNISFDGQNISERFWNVRGADFDIADVTIKNFKTLNTSYTAGIRVDMETLKGNNFKITNCTIKNIWSKGDGGTGAASSSISRAVNFFYTETNVPATVDVIGGEMSGIWGVDGDAFHSFTADHNHNVVTTIDGTRFFDNSRRDIKFHTSFCHAKNTIHDRILSTSTGFFNSCAASISYALLSGAQQSDLVTWNVGSSVIDCTFNIVDPFQAVAVGVNSCKDFIGTGNTFNVANTSIYGGWLVASKHENNLIELNTMNNTGGLFGSSNLAAPAGNGTKFINNTHNIVFNSQVVNTGYAVYRQAINGTIRDFIFDQNTFNVDFQFNVNPYRGIVASTSTGNIFAEVNITNSIVNYTGPSKLGKKFIDNKSPMDSTNSIVGNTVNGIDPFTGGIQIDGVQTVVTSGNTDGLGNTITVI